MIRLRIQGAVESILDLIVPILLHLQGATNAPTMEEDLASQVRQPSETAATPEEASALNAEEFRAFLARDRDQNGI